MKTRSGSERMDRGGREIAVHEREERKKRERNGELNRRPEAACERDNEVGRAEATIGGD